MPRKANQWRTLMRRLDRYMAIRGELQDFNTEPTFILRPRGMARSRYRFLVNRLVQLEEELPEIIYDAFTTGPERNRQTENQSYE